MKQARYKEPLPLAVIEAARAGDAGAVEQVLQYYNGYINKLCIIKGIFCRLMEQDFFLMFLPKFSVTICIDRRPDDVIMNVRFVYVGADHKGVIALGKPLDKFHAQAVCFLRRDFTGFE